MPSLPVYNSKQNIVPQQAAPFQDVAAQASKDQQQMLGTVQKITQQWSDANDVMQYSKSKADHGIAIAQIEAKAKADPNFNNSGQYFQEIDKANEQTLSGISNKMVMQKAALENNQDAMIAKIKIQGDFRQKQIAVNKVNLENSISMQIQKKLTLPPGSEAEAAHIDANINEMVSLQLHAQTITPEEAKKFLEDANQTSTKYQIYNDPSTTEAGSQVLKDLRDPNGKYAKTANNPNGLTPEDRLKMIEESQRRIFQNNQTMKKEVELSKDSKFTEVFTKANEGTLTLNDLDNQMKIPEDKGGIPKQQLLTIRKSLQTRIKTDLETIVDNNDKAGDYLKFVDNFISDETDRQKGREAIVNAFKDNILSPKEASFLNQLKRETEDVQWSKQKEQMAGNNLIPFKNSINATMDFFRGKDRHNEKDAAIAIKKLLGGVSDGGDPVQLTKEIIYQDQITKNPRIPLIPKEGEVHMDSNGNIFLLFPDGHTEPIDVPTKGNK